MSSQVDVRVAMREIATLKPHERERMFELFSGHFANVQRDRFEHDLSEKEWALTLQVAGSDSLEGFSTLSRLQTVVDGTKVCAFFSGDTFFKEEHQNAQIVLKTWLEHVLKVAETMPAGPIYWLLLTSTYRTYRFLPFLFRTFYPSPDWPVPEMIDRHRQALVWLKFPDEYDAGRGVVVLKEPTPVRAGEISIPQGRRRDRYVTYFLEANPGHANSDFLVCLTELRRQNLSESGAWLLEQ